MDHDGRVEGLGFDGSLNHNGHEEHEERLRAKAGIRRVRGLKRPARYLSSSL
jgi:hypothetical protein